MFINISISQDIIKGSVLVCVMYGVLLCSGQIKLDKETTIANNADLGKS